MLLTRALTLARPARASPAGHLAAPRAHRASPRDVRAAVFKGILKKLRPDSESAGVYGSQQGRDDFEMEDVDYYFEYTGMLAVEKNYDRLNQLKGLGLAACDLLLLMAASENDAPKVAELLRAGADTGVADLDGRTPTQLATNEIVLAMLADRQKAFTF